MKLEQKFFNSFFYPFLIALLINMITVTIFLSIYTINYLDEKTGKNVVDLEKKYAKVNINSINSLLTTTLLKVQSGINEQILFYLKLANKIDKINSYEINEYLVSIKDTETVEKEKLKLSAFWFIDNEITGENLENDDPIKLQLIAYSNIIPNIYSILEATKSSVISYFFIFEKTDLLIGFPLSYYSANIDIFRNYRNNPVWCCNDKGEIYKTYKFRCRDYYVNCKKAKEGIYDYNKDDLGGRTIFVTNPYKQFGNYYFYNVFNMCIRFDDPITKGEGFACADIYQDDLIFSFDNFNSKIVGYYLITSVGFNNAFYYPQNNDNSKTTVENIFRWDRKFYLEEKTYFMNHIQKLMTSNYYRYLNETNSSIFEEIKINGVNTSDQYFYFNGEKFYFSLFPIILEGITGLKEHVLTIAYFYNNRLYYERLKSYTPYSIIKIVLQIIIFIVFGSGLLYLVVLSFNTLAKYIVIPIKNVNYMLKGIHIGGENRLEYLEKDNINLNDMEYNGELIDPNVDYNKKYDSESEYIEKEINFYDFDEELLQYRPLEIDRLVKVLLELKGALLLTSIDHEVEEIINYSHSEEIFRNFKNKEGTAICQSNIGNLQSQLLKFDKAIYHLALSLQDEKLKRFLSKTLSDELDESDTLLHSISLSFNKDKNKERINKLVEKQQNSTHDNFSQKIIGILINSRYCKLINVYFKFFSIMQQSNIESLNGLFMNTNYHTINYYHKILIQYIYLSYVKNDLVKIGESILDYIEFLIKFKFKLSNEKKYLLNIHNRERPEYKDKQNYKKKIFDKILSWLNLFDNYVSHIRDNSSLGDDKSIVDDYVHNLNSANTELSSGSQSAFLFRVNIQRGDFLKGKFALACKNYNDALFFFIRAAKKKSIVLDGLIQKKALKHIFKLSLKITKKLKNYGMINFPADKRLSEYEKIRHSSIKKKPSNYYEKNNEDGKDSVEKIENTFRDEMDFIKNVILQDISGCNAKQAKDIIILIDFNNYGIDSNINKIEAYIDQTKIILNNYLSSNDRLGVFIYTNQYQIICPLISKVKIDINNFSKDLIYYKNRFFNEDEKRENYIKQKDLENPKIDFQSNNNNNNNFSESRSQEDSFDEEEIQNKDLSIIISGLLKSINYIQNYLRMKEAVKNEKYIILFTDLFNYFKISDEDIKGKFEKLPNDKEVHFLLVGKNKLRNVKNEKGNSLDEYEEKKINELVKKKFGIQSELIDFENMKKIKTILSNNNVIKDEITYPNEIYK